MDSRLEKIETISYTPLTTHQEWVKGFQSLVAGASFAMSHFQVSIAGLMAVRSYFNPTILKASDILNYASQMNMQIPSQILKHIPYVNMSEAATVGLAITAAITFTSGVVLFNKVLSDE